MFADDDPEDVPSAEDRDFITAVALAADEYYHSCCDPETKELANFLVSRFKLKPDEFDVELDLVSSGTMITVNIRNFRIHVEVHD